MGDLNKSGGGGEGYILKSITVRCPVSWSVSISAVCINVYLNDLCGSACFISKIFFLKFPSPYLDEFTFVKGSPHEMY
jgi:hypothetical protein